MAMRVTVIVAAKRMVMFLRDTEITPSSNTNHLSKKDFLLFDLADEVVLPQSPQAQDD